MLASRIHVLLIKAKRDSKSIIGIRFAKRQTGRHRGLPLRMAVGTTKGINVIRWSRIRPASRCGRTRRSAPTRRICQLMPIQRLSVGDSNIENGPVARRYRFWKQVHEQRAKNTSSVSAGGHCNPPLHRICGTYRIQNRIFR